MQYTFFIILNVGWLATIIYMWVLSSYVYHLMHTMESPITTHTIDSDKQIYSTGI